MTAAVRSYSRSGNTKAIAEAIAKAAGVEAVSVDAPNAVLNETVDTLFIGGALYAYGIDKHLKEYLATLKSTDAAKAVIFTSSWISRHTVELIRRQLTEAGIAVAEEDFYVRGKPGAEDLAKAADFAKKYL